jgi:hypothetical protein
VIVAVRIDDPTVTVFVVGPVHVAVDELTGEPLLWAVFQLSVIARDGGPGTAEMLKGPYGTPTRNGTDADGSPRPAAFSAWTKQSTVVPFVSPATVSGDADPALVCDPQVTR